MGADGGGYDFFVSYTQADRAWAEWIAWILEEDGHRVLVQAWDFVPGSSWQRLMQDGAASSTRTIAVLSQAYLSSDYGTAEWLAAWARDPSGAERTLLTMRVVDCERPGYLSGVTGIDLFGLDEAKARARLRKAVADAIAGRAKPDLKPGFPGTGHAIPQPARFPGALPSVWKVPPRNPNFTGRSDDLERLERGMTAGSRVIVHSLHGMGGVGKSQLATEYAHRKADRYDLVWWVDAEKSATIADQFVRLAGELGLEAAATDPETLQAQVHHALRGIAGWLLILDNADDIATLRPWLPTAPTPAGIPGHVIVTTRRGGFRTLGEVVDVDVLDPTEAVALLSRRVPDLDPGIAGEIAEALGRLPLALEQTAAYLDRTNIPPAEYLRLLRTRTEAMLDKGKDATHGDNIATVWTLSFERLQLENPAATQFMDICAYMAPDAIPLNLFTTHPEELPDPLSATVSDPLAFTEAIAAIVDYSLAKRTADYLHVHRLIQAALRARQRLGAVPSPSLGDQP